MFSIFELACFRNVLHVDVSKNCWMSDNEDPNQTMCYVASVLGLHGLPWPVCLNNTVSEYCSWRLSLQKHAYSNILRI